MRIHSRRGGVLLDAVLAIGILMLGAYGLSRLGITLPQILQGVHQFLGP